MSSIAQAVKERLVPEERLKKKVHEALDVADRIIIEARGQQVSVDKCLAYQGAMLAKLGRVADDALKVGNKPLYVRTGKLMDMIGQWHGVTKQIKSDEDTMIEFVSMVKTFSAALIEYRQVVRDFEVTSKEFNFLKDLGVSVPEMLNNTSIKAAKAFRDISDGIGTFKAKYTPLGELTFIDDDGSWSKRFDEERKLMQTRSSEDSKT